MDHLYNGTLLLAMVATGVGALAGMLALMRRTERSTARDDLGSEQRWLLLAFGAVLLGGFSLLVSFVVHAVWGHGAASAEPMDFATLLAAHPSFAVVGLVLIIDLALVVYARKRRRARHIGE